MLTTICTWIHEWSDIWSRSAFVCCTYHQAFSCMSPLTASSSAAALVSLGGRPDLHLGDRFFVHGWKYRARPTGHTWRGAFAGRRYDPRAVQHHYQEAPCSARRRFR
jgi:hypothetical protein